MTCLKLPVNQLNGFILVKKSPGLFKIVCDYKGPFKYYVIKEVGGWDGQMMMFDDKVGG